MQAAPCAGLVTWSRTLHLHWFKKDEIEVSLHLLQEGHSDLCLALALGRARATSIPEEAPLRAAVRLGASEPTPGLSDIPSPFLLPACLALPQTLTSARCPQERPPPATTTATTTWAASTVPAVWAMFSTGTSAPAQVSHSWKGEKGDTMPGPAPTLPQDATGSSRT